MPAEVNVGVGKPFSIDDLQSLAPKSRGRPPRTGSILSAIMVKRRLRNNTVAVALDCGDRMFYNYLARRHPIPARALLGLCQLLDLDPEDLVDSDGYLLLAAPEQSSVDQGDDW